MIPELKINDPKWRGIHNRLGRRWSSRQVFEFLYGKGTDGAIIPVRGKTISNYIELHMMGELMKSALLKLRRRGKTRRRTLKRRGMLLSMTSIDER